MALDKVVGVFSEKTMVPLGIVMLLGYVLVHATQMGDQVTAEAAIQTQQQAEITELKKAQENYNKSLTDLKVHVIRIEDAVGVKVKPDADSP